MEGKEAATARARLLRDLEQEAAEVADSYGTPRLSPRVLGAMASVRREEFVAAGDESLAYANVPLAIGYGQTISQPFMVALMTELLRITPDDVILEVGTGSGYQTALLAELAKRVHSIEIVEELANQAHTRLARLGYQNVEIRHGDGHEGWPDAAPFDGIIVTAAVVEIPPALLNQLKPGGRMVVPVGPQGLGQDLVLVEKSVSGETERRAVLPVAFVPLTRKKH